MSGRLPEILARYRALDKSLADPDVAANAAKVRELMKERGRIERPARLCEEYVQVRREIREAEELVDRQPHSLAGPWPSETTRWARCGDCNQCVAASQAPARRG